MDTGIANKNAQNPIISNFFLHIEIILAQMLLEMMGT